MLKEIHSDIKFPAKDTAEQPYVQAIMPCCSLTNPEIRVRPGCVMVHEEWPQHACSAMNVESRDNTLCDLQLQIKQTCASWKPARASGFREACHAMWRYVVVTIHCYNSSRCCSHGAVSRTIPQHLPPTQALC